MFARLSVVPYGRMQFIDVHRRPARARSSAWRPCACTRRPRPRTRASPAWSARKPHACVTVSPSSARRRRPACERRGAGGLAPAASALARGAWRTRYDRRSSIILILIVFGRRLLSDETPQLAIVGVIVLAGVVSWLVTRWRIEDDDLRIETGLLRRQSLRFPLAQIQAIDVVRPGLARMFRVAELRLRMAGRAARRRDSRTSPSTRSSRSATSCSPWRAVRATTKKGPSLRPTTSRSRPRNTSLAVVPSGPLVASILLENWWLVVILVGLLIGRRRLAAHRRRPAGGRRLHLGDQHGHLPLAPVQPAIPADRRGRAGRSAPARRARRLDGRGDPAGPRAGRAAGRASTSGGRSAGAGSRSTSPADSEEGEGEAQRGQLRALIPVGKRSLGIELVDWLLPDRPRELSRPPRRVRWKSPFRYPALSWGRSDTCVATTSGRLRRVTCWVPLEKVQSLRHVQGPVQRRLRLASVHVDTAGRTVHATLRDRDAAEAARRARRPDRSRARREEATGAHLRSSIGAAGRGP